MLRNEHCGRTTITGIRIKNEVQEYIENEFKGNKPYNYFITLATNHHYNINSLQKKIDAWRDDIKKMIFYDGIYQENIQEHFKYCGFLEFTKANKYPHYHLLVYVNPERAEVFCDQVEDLWLKQVRKGDFNIQEITKDKDHLTEYLIKTLDRPFSYDNTIWG